MDKARPQPDPWLLHPVVQLFDYLPSVCFFVKNRRGEFQYANAEFVSLMGVPALAALLGKTDFDCSPRELASRFARDDRLVMRTGRPVVNRVELVPNADGSIRWHLTTKIALRDASGDIIGLAGITRDLNRASVTFRRYDAMAPVMQHLEDHYAEPVTIGALAALAHLSVSQFERRFKALFHATPAHYLVQLRLSKASHLLATSSAKITDVAAQCGFYDHSHFIRNFRRVFGVSPSAYRRLHA
jgi:PAS domain S-box-containing protein